MSITSVLDYLNIVAVLAAGLLAGGAFYILISMNPELSEFGVNEHWRFFPYIYKRSAISQPSLTIVAVISSIVYGIRIVDAPFYRYLWIATGIIFLTISPFTKTFAPTNTTIINDNKLIKAGNESKINSTIKKELLDEWTTFHSIRTAIAIVGFGTMIYGLSRH